jgi:hypothetical protein
LIIFTFVCESRTQQRVFCLFRYLKGSALFMVSKSKATNHGFQFGVRQPS